MTDLIPYSIDALTGVLLKTNIILSLILVTMLAIAAVTLFLYLDSKKQNK